MADPLEHLRKINNRHIENQAIKIKTTHILVMISKYHSPIKETETPREMASSTAKKGKLYKMRLVNFVVPESRKVLKNISMGSCQKDAGFNLKELPMAKAGTI